MDALIGGALALVFILLAVYARSRIFGFPAQRPGDYADVEPEFDLRTRLDGDLICEGVIFGPMGRVTSRFVGDFNVTWEGDTGVMHEHFKYCSGESQRRAWHLKLEGDGKIRATAKDVEGDGIGQQTGPTVQMRYKLRLPDSSGGYLLSAVDWMYLTPNGSIVNRSQFRKYGIKVAELVATMRRKETTE